MTQEGRETSWTGGRRGPPRIEWRYEHLPSVPRFTPISAGCFTCDRADGLTVLVVSNQKGGVGKTTTAISVGAALVEHGQRVLIVDLDPQANATSGLGISKAPPNHIYGLILKEQPIDDSIIATAVPGLDLIPSGPDMAGAEVELVPLMAREYRLRQALRATHDYDTILVDCPPSLGLLTINALTAGDAVVIPVQCEYYALEGLAQLLATIEAVRARLNSRLEVLAIVLTMEDRRNRLSLQVIDEVRNHFPTLVADARIPRAVRLAEAPSHGLPISVYDRRSAGAQAYDDLARELSARLRAKAPIALGGAIA
ncbi:MAG: ParA family protein [Chloroflexi bacterium]|nr:MAG: ParA family protein [Chloroflexota bacterium]